MEAQGLDFTYDPESRSLVASFTPEAGVAPPTIDVPWLEERIAELGHGALRGIAAALGVLADSIKGARPVAALAVAEAVDAKAEVSVAGDKMAAFLSITPPQGGAPIDDAAIRRALAQQGVTGFPRRTHQGPPAGSARSSSFKSAEAPPALTSSGITNELRLNTAANSSKHHKAHTNHPGRFQSFMAGVNVQACKQASKAPKPSVSSAQPQLGPQRLTSQYLVFQVG